MSTPLAVDDPPRLGRFWLRARVATDPAGVAYDALDEDGTACRVVLLGTGAQSDAGALERFEAATSRLGDDRVLARNGVGDYRDDVDTTAWVAIRGGDSETSAVAAGLLAAAAMTDLAHPVPVRGPGFWPHFHRRNRPGGFRLWPLPFPGRVRFGSTLAILIALLLMIALMFVFLLIAWLLWHNKPPVTPPQPIPVTTTGTETSGPTPPQTTPAPSSSQPASPSDTGPTTTAPGTIPTTISLSPGQQTSNVFVFRPTAAQ